MDLLTVIKECFSKDLPIEYFRDKQNHSESFSETKYILLGKSLFDKNSKTAYKRKGKEGGLYDLITVCFALKTQHLSVSEYIKESRANGVEIVSTVDRMSLLRFLKGETELDYTPLECVAVELESNAVDEELETAMKEEISLVEPTRLLCREKDLRSISKEASIKILQEIENHNKNKKNIQSSSVLDEISSMVKQKKRGKEETVPLIVVLSFPGSDFSFESIRLFLSEGKLETSSDKKRGETGFVRIKKEKSKEVYDLTDNPHKVTDEDWERVVAVVSQKKEPWHGEWKEKTDARVFFFCFEDYSAEYDPQQVQIVFSRTKRHLDPACFVKFWSFID